MTRILVFSSWSIHEGITQATVLPLIATLNKHKGVEKVFLCTIEPQQSKPYETSFTQVVHVPYFTNPTALGKKVLNVVTIPLFLKRLLKQSCVDLLWCKGAPAGGIGALVHSMTNTPYVVDSLEPHSDYMVDSGTWRRWHPKFLLQKSLEKLTLRHAFALLPVSHHYAERLAKLGVDRERMFVLPCIVMIDQFHYSQEVRMLMRRTWSIDEEWTVGIYVGKYGGLYYDYEAFVLYKRLFECIGEKFFLVLITETEPGFIRQRIEALNLPIHRILISKLPHARIPDALSAADFAISTIKSVPAMRYCSPIKHGEYWAADLPILSTLADGDDAGIMKDEGGGVIVAPDDPDIAVRIEEVLNDTAVRGAGRYSNLACKYRHPDQLRIAVEFVLKRLVTIKRGAY